MFVGLYDVGVEYDTVYHSSGHSQPEEGEEDNQSYPSCSKGEEQS